MLLYLSISQLLVLEFTILPLFILYAPKQKLILKCIRWQSSRTWAHLLLQELQNYNLLLNNSRQENVGSHQKKITHIQGQSRSPSKTVGGVKPHLESSPISTRHSEGSNKTFCAPGDSHRDWVRPAFECLLKRYGSAVACPGGRSLGVAGLGRA